MRRREGNKERDIIRAAIKVFAKNGFHKAKVATIAEKAKIGTGSVYLYFDSKVDILNKIFENLWKGLNEEAEAITSNDYPLLEKVELLIDDLFKQYLSNKKLAALFVSEQNFYLDHSEATYKKFYDQYFSKIEGLIESGISNGVVYKEYNPQIIKHLVIGGIRALINNYVTGADKFDIAEMKKQILLFMKKGLFKTSRK